jgi:hypothetical protein
LESGSGGDVLSIVFNQANQNMSIMYVEKIMKELEEFINYGDKSGRPYFFRDLNFSEKAAAYLLTNLDTSCTMGCKKHCLIIVARLEKNSGKRSKRDEMLLEKVREWSEVEIRRTSLSINADPFNPLPGFGSGVL